ncbi:peptidoglycan-binding protein [Microbacterium sp. NPDC016588]
MAFSLGCGAVTGAALAYEALPPPTGALADIPVETDYPVAITDYRDQHALALTPAFAEGTVMSSAVNGTVTASRCVPGQPFKSGTPAFDINGVPVVALAAETPFFRDLTWGDAGPDVVALRGTLSALGFDVAPTGPFRDDARNALRELQKREGMAHRDGDFILADILWTPAPSPTVATCTVQIGQHYSSGNPVATTAATLLSLAVSGESAGALLPGARTVNVLDVDVVLPESGVLTDPGALARVAGSPRGREQLTGKKTGEAATVSATSALTTPLHVAAVPVSSVFAIVGSSGCVASAPGTTHQVSIVGVSLGMSLVTFDDAPPSRVLLDTAQNTCHAG